MKSLLVSPSDALNNWKANEENMCRGDILSFKNFPSSGIFVQKTLWTFYAKVNILGRWITRFFRKSWHSMELWYFQYVLYCVGFRNFIATSKHSLFRTKIFFHFESHQTNLKYSFRAISISARFLTQADIRKFDEFKVEGESIERLRAEMFCSEFQFVTTSDRWRWSSIKKKEAIETKTREEVYKNVKSISEKMFSRDLRCFITQFPMFSSMSAFFKEFKEMKTASSTESKLREISEL